MKLFFRSILTSLALAITSLNASDLDGAKALLIKAMAEEDQYQWPLSEENASTLR